MDWKRRRCGRLGFKGEGGGLVLRGRLGFKGEGGGLVLRGRGEAGKWEKILNEEKFDLHSNTLYIYILYVPSIYPVLYVPSIYPVIYIRIPYSG